MSNGALFVLVVAVAIGGIGGYAVGDIRQRAVLGAILGLVAGPFGWIVVACLPTAETAEAEELRIRRDERIREEERRDVAAEWEKRRQKAAAKA